MELKQYFYLFRRWAWLLALGLILGGLGAYIFSRYQPVVYQTATTVMVMRPSQEQSSDITWTMSDWQLTKTYSQLLIASPVRDMLEKELGYPLEAGISVKEITDSLLLQITVRGGDPQKLAEIANTLVEVFIQYNEQLQNNRYAASEESLQAQIKQVEGQIDSLQEQMTTVSEQTLQTQQQQVESQMQTLDAEIVQVKDEIASIQSAFAAATAQSAGTQPAPTLTTGETDVLTARQMMLDEKQQRLDELTSLRDLYQQVYVNLLVSGESDQVSNDNNHQEQLQATLALYQQIYANLIRSYEDVRLSRLGSTPNVVQIEPAPVPIAPVQPQPLRNGMLGAASGLLIMGAIAFLIEYLDDTLKTPEDINEALGLPVIGLIGEMERPAPGKGPGVYVAHSPRSPVSEAFRTLRTNLDFASVDKPIRSLLITSASPSEGKSTVAVNLAAVMAQGERKVILVDADLRKPNLHRFLEISNRTGLTDIFRSRAPEPVVVSHVTATWGEPSFKVIPSGSLPPNPAELLGSERMSNLLDALSEQNDLVIVDGPPAIVADSVLLAARVSGVLLVIEPGKTKIDAAQAMLEQLNRAGARVIGVVMNPISRKRSNYYSGRYRYYSEYYYSRGYSHYTGESSSATNRNGAKPKPEKEPA